MMTQPIDDMQDLIALLDYYLRENQYVFDTKDDYEMYNNIDVLYVVEYSFRLFRTMVRYVRGNDRDMAVLRIVSFFYFIKLWTDIVLVRPYTFAWHMIHETGYTELAHDLQEFLRVVEYDEFLYIVYTSL